MACWQPARGGLNIRVRLTPKGGADRIEGTTQLADGSEVLAARVRAAAENGAANASLERLIAGALGVAPSQIAVVSGHKARLKTVHVAADAAALGSRLAALAADEMER